VGKQEADKKLQSPPASTLGLSEYKQLLDAGTDMSRSMKAASNRQMSS
jgi:hypothetical protein